MARNRRIDEATNELVQKAFKNAKELMGQEGFVIGDGVQVAVDPGLPFMGYTMPQNGGFRIVVSGMAVKSGTLQALLIHEMSHVFRMKTHHPSHNGRIIGEAINNLGKRGFSRRYRQTIITQLVNDIQDLYADDISIQIVKKWGLMRGDQLTSFISDWVKDEPVQSSDSVRDRWVNSSTLVHNARAISQMARHQIKDTDNNAANANMRFLSQVSPRASGEFDYFRDLLKNLKEDITEEEYRILLAEYLNRFLETVGYMN